MPTSCLSCFSVRSARRESLVPKYDTSPSCSTRVPHAISLEEYSDAQTEPDSAVDQYRSRLEYFRELCCDDRFISESGESGVDLSYIPRGHDPLIARGRLHIEDCLWQTKNLREISELILDHSKRHIWDNDLFEVEILETRYVSPTESVVRMWAAFKGKFGFQGRDFFWDVYVYITDDELVHVTMPGHDDGMNRHPGRFTRGRTLIGGLRISKKRATTSNNGVEMVLINQTDVGGKRLVPDWVIDSVMKKSPMKLVAIKNFIDHLVIHFE